jgi:hypothetical protein
MDKEYFIIHVVGEIAAGLIGVQTFCSWVGRDR